MFKRRDKKERLQIHDLQPLSGERGIDKSIPSLPRASLQKKAGKTLQINLRILPAFFFAEREGFEPPVPRSTTVFKTAAIDHSAISPNLFFKSACFQKRCKGTTIF